MKINFRKPLATIFAAILTLTVVSTATAANNETTSQDIYRIVALGDSISVGFEPTPEIIAETSAPYGYVDRLYEQALFHSRSEFANYAIMGLTTPGLTKLLQGATDRKPLSSADLQDFSSFQAGVSKQADRIAALTPQLATDLAKANLVVLTIGGNDFSSIVKDAIDISNDKPIESARQIIQDSFEIRMNEYTKDLDKMMSHLHELAPDAQIVISDQYLPLFKGHPLYPVLVEAVNKLADKLDTFAIDLNQKGIPVRIAHISTKFIGNEASFTYFNAWEKYDTHPKQAGYEAIAQSFAEIVWKQYVKPAPRAADVPISVVINGKEPPNKAVLLKGTTFLALRDVANAVGADLKWTQKTNTAIFSKNGREVIVTIGAKTIIVNGVTQPLETPAYFQQVGKEQKTYVPLAVISKGLDYQVIYSKKLNTAFINS
ncbi:stalk domain-containing protein [Cohnella sp. WQ 127256]|uniref:stalk domain-containing protein n=1 Tax=Cohnella sp. WQ 127256 TaxID=2938790 RepID=UPI00211992CF|nr:stalk domain-containing protein [Cohnella sp. WQ 127256]